MPDHLTQKAPAKVNLALHVVGKRTDGYHLLESLAVFTDAGDGLTARAADRDAIVVRGRFAAQVPIDGANLVARARDLMRETFGAAAAAPVALELEKELPVASGIGGGSSDAAAAMRLLARFWNIESGMAELQHLGLALGADVPMCLCGQPLIARGIGEAIEGLPGFPALPLVLVNPGVPVNTADVFSRLAETENPPLPPLAATSGRQALAGWLAATRNDLEGTAIGLAPEIGTALAGLREQGALVARMSGSGATCFGIFASDDDARRAAGTIVQAHAAWFVVATQGGGTQGETNHAGQ